MSKHDTWIRIRDMLDHAREAVTLLDGRSRDDLEHDRVLSLALVRLLEVVGEAVNRIPQKVQVEHPEIPWSEIIGMRNRLIHGYGSIDLDIVWQIVIADLPPLVNALEKIAVEDSKS
jgi:uncharacterized protein with HEPN domain